MSKCQWIDGDPLKPGWEFCGEQTMAPGAPWCRAHYERVYQFERRPTAKRSFRRTRPTRPTDQKAA